MLRLFGRSQGGMNTKFKIVVISWKGESFSRINTHYLTRRNSEDILKCASKENKPFSRRGKPSKELCSCAMGMEPSLFQRVKTDVEDGGRIPEQQKNQTTELGAWPRILQTKLTLESPTHKTGPAPWHLLAGSQL